MSLVSNNIRSLRKKMHYTQEQFAQKMQIKRSLIGSYEEGRAEPRLDYLKKMAAIFGITVDELISENFSAGKAVPEKEDLQESPRSPEASPRRYTAKNEEETSAGILVTIPLVNKAEMQQYRFHFADPHYIEALPAISLPVQNDEDELRAFDVADAGMAPIPQGAIVVGKYIHDLPEIADHHSCILLLKNQGVIFRRMENKMGQNSKIKIYPDNDSFPEQEISVLEIEEIWEAKLVIAQPLAFTQGAKNTSNPKNEIEQLNERVNALNQELEYLKRQFRKHF